MTAPKVKPAVRPSTPIEIDDSQVVSARDETIRRAKGKGFAGTILTGFQMQGPGGLKQILG